MLKSDIINKGRDIMQYNSKLAAIIPSWLMSIWAYFVLFNVVTHNSSLLRTSLAVSGFIGLATLSLYATWAVRQKKDNQ